MALDFTGATSDRVVVSASSELNNLATLTWAGWVYRTGSTLSRNMGGKNPTSGFPAGWGPLFIHGGASAGDVKFARWRTSDDDNAISSTNALPLNTWRFVAFTYDEDGGAGERAQIYYGGLETTVAEESSYNTQTNTNDATIDDSGSDFYIGNAGNTASNFPGIIARVGYYNTKLSLEELRALQFASLPGWNRSDCVLLHDYFGTGTQTDLSGNGNDGTVTGAAAAAHVPLSNLDWAPYASAAAAASGGAPLLQIQHQMDGGFNPLNGGFSV